MERNDSGFSALSPGIMSHQEKSIDFRLDKQRCESFPESMRPGVNGQRDFAVPHLDAGLLSTSWHKLELRNIDSNNPESSDFIPMTDFDVNPRGDKESLTNEARDLDEDQVEEEEEDDEDDEDDEDEFDKENDDEDDDFEDQEEDRDEEEDEELDEQTTSQRSQEG